MKNIHYQINDQSSALFMQVMGELIMRTNQCNGTLMDSVRKTLCLSTAYARHGICARFFAIVDNRKAWIIPSQNAAGDVIVWFSDDGRAPNWNMDATLCKGEGNVLPNTKACSSSFFSSIKKAMDAIEQYVFEGILPDNAMPPGQLQSLSGEE